MKGPGPRSFLPILAPKQPFLRNRSLGQLPGAGGFPQPAGATGMKCYRCGNQGVRSMLPSMAAMVPGGCVEVAQSECETPTTGTGSWGAPTIPGSTFMDGPTEITVQVKEPTELKPYGGGADVVIRGYNIRDFQPSTGAPNLTEIAKGKTDERGQYVWSGQAPSPNIEYHYQVSISIPGQARPK